MQKIRKINVFGIPLVQRAKHNGNGMEWDGV